MGDSVFEIFVPNTYKIRVITRIISEFTKKYARNTVKTKRIELFIKRKKYIYTFRVWIAYTSTRLLKHPEAEPETSQLPTPFRDGNRFRGKGDSLPITRFQFSLFLLRRRSCFFFFFFVRAPPTHLRVPKRINLTRSRVNYVAERLRRAIR